MTMLLERPAPAQDSVETPEAAENQVVLYDISWEQYEQIGDALLDRPGLRLTYDEGTLEIMTTSHLHELRKKRVAALLEALADELGIAIAPGGNMTFKRKTLKKGLEPDECYWIAHEPEMRDKEDYDQYADPPPDLVLEIELSRRLVPRLPILAALGVPEVWRYHRGGLEVLLLQPDGGYQASPESPTFPGIPVTEIPRFLPQAAEVGYLAMVRAFREWVRSQLANGDTAGQAP